MSSDDDALLLRLGTQVANARHERGLTQAAVAEEVGIDQRSLQRIEAGRTAPSLHRLKAIAEVLEVPITELLEPAMARRRRKKASRAKDDGSRESATLLRLWDKLTPDRKRLALKIIRVIANEPSG